MMTTESKQDRRTRGAAPLLGAAIGALAAGILVALAGLAIDGTPALLAGGGGVLLALVVMALGAFTVDLVARVMPAASLLVALLTYVLQLVLMTVALLGVERAGALDDRGHGLWLAGGVVAVVVVWGVAQLVLTTRRRIPVFDVALPGER